MQYANVIGNYTEEKRKRKVNNMDEKRECVQCGAEADEGSTMCRDCREAFGYIKIVDKLSSEKALQDTLTNIQLSVNARQRLIDYLGEITFLQQSAIIMIRKELREVYGVKGGK